MLVPGAAESFGWTAKGAYSSASDVLAVIFTTAAGETETLWAVTNRAEQTTLQNVSIPLAAVAGTRGTLRLVFSHTGSNFAYAGYGATVRDARARAAPLARREGPCRRGGVGRGHGRGGAGRPGR